jgi:hypothetical protein
MPTAGHRTDRRAGPTGVFFEPAGPGRAFHRPSSPQRRTRLDTSGAAVAYDGTGALRS